MPVNSSLEPVVSDPLPPPARWVSALDTLVLALLALSLFVVMAGRPVITKYGQFVLPTAAQILFAAIGVIAARHAACPRPWFGASLGRWRRRLDQRPYAASAFRAFVCTRPLVFLIGYLAVVSIGFPPRPVGFSLSPDPLANLPSRFDAGWYGGIARNGYQWDNRFDRQRNIAFFPAMPMLMRPVGSFLGANVPTMPSDKRMLRMLWAGVFVSLCTFAAALWYLSRLSHLVAGPTAAAHAPMLLAAYPFAVFFNVPYSESLFLLAAVGAFYHFHRREWIRASIWGLVVGLSRPNGALVSIALGILALEQVFSRRVPADQAPRESSWLRPLATGLTVAAMPGIGMLGFTTYLYFLTGVWFAWARMHGAWGREWSVEPLTAAWARLTADGITGTIQALPYDSMNSMAVLFAAGLVWLVYRRLGTAYAAFVLVNLVPPVFAGGALSMGRVTSTLFPLFIALAATLRPASIPGWAAGFGVLQGLAAALFFTWRDIF
jgi:hypothetical protein